VKLHSPPGPFDLLDVALAKVISPFRALVSLNTVKDCLFSYGRSHEICFRTQN
jgi:hypothetical protein